VRRARLTGRGIAVLAGAVVSYVAGWVFGTRELAALALALACSLPLALALAWWASRGQVALTRRLPARATAGERLQAAVSLEPAPSLVTASLVERAAGLGDPVAELVRDGGRLAGSWSVADPPRGRYPLAPELVLEDPLGLARVRVAIEPAALLRVEPRLVELAPARGPGPVERDGIRHAFASNVGDGIAGVRDHEVGESLRHVHWRTTARRGRLTVRELEERPRDALLVVLDGAAGRGGARRTPAFECAVRAAGSLALHAVRTGVAVSFTSTGARPVQIDVVSASAATPLIDALCVVERDGRRPLAEALPEPAGARLCIVTADVSPALVERLRALRSRRRAVSLVAIDEGSWSGAPGEIDAAVSRLAELGVDTAVVRASDDLAVRLAALVRTGVAGAA
jgi:uncharacterized protein (DUF58 family)